MKQTNRTGSLTCAKVDQAGRGQRQVEAGLLLPADKQVTFHLHAGSSKEIPAHQPQLRLLGTVEAAPDY